MLAAIAACANDLSAPPQSVGLRPVHSSPAPLSSFYDIAIVSEEVVCTINSCESQIHCVNRTTAGITTFGRQGGGPGEFLGLLGIERGPDGRVAALDAGSGRMISFNPDGTGASAERMPSHFYPVAAS
ncbi:MAG: hypothetical protein OXQ93_08115 [Gemmatimonadota bacterium]|nr:hypothetical protein [Gemmatimonadota bacterium]